MNTSEIIGKAKESCTDEGGRLDKTKFRVIVGTMFYAESDEDQQNEELVSAYNKSIRRVLGSGHSLISYLQFCKGKKAKPYMDLINGEATKASLGLS